MTAAIHPASYNAGIDAAFDALRRLRARLESADLSGRQKRLLFATIDGLLEHGGELRLELPRPGEPEPDGAPRGPDGPVVGGAAVEVLAGGVAA